jgi:hypothetical protein
VKFLSSQHKANQSDVRIVLEEANLKEASAAVAVEDSVAAKIEDSVEEALIAAQERCIKQFVTNASKNAKFLSNQQKENLFTARNATQRTKNLVKKISN